MKKRFSFTLVEILVVTALVSLLAVIGFAGYGYAMTASRRAAAEATLQQISAGLENFKIKNGYYPVSASFTVISATKDSKDMIDSITFDTKKYSKGGTDKGFEAFIKPLDQEKLKKSIDGSGDFADSWGGKIYYKYPGAFNKTGFDLIAPGEDGSFGKSNVATPSETLSDYKDGSDWICDDISNFMDK